MDTNVSNLSNLTSKIRDYINNPRIQFILLKDKAEWNKLCSSLDIIEDTELAIEAYNNLKTTNSGELYLYIYGIFQILFVQQDAISHIAESLNIEYILDENLLNIRDIRNDSIGHPSKRGKGKGDKFNFITRSGMDMKGFTLITYHATDLEYKFKNIDIPHLIFIQKEKHSIVLNKIIKKLKDEEMEHKNKYIKIKVKDTLPKTLHYFCEKISETINGNMPSNFGEGIVDILIKNIKTFKDTLNERGLLEPLDSVKYLLENIEYPISTLKNYFKDNSNSIYNSKDAEIFNFYIEMKIDELLQIADEIDEQYEENEN